MEKTIEQQIAELTDEQKKSMQGIYKKYFTSMGVVLVCAILIIAVIFVYAHVQQENARDVMDAIELSRGLAELNGEFYVGSADDNLRVIDKYYDMAQLKPLSLVIGGVIGLIGEVIIYLIFKKKYPYFSEKKYKYLKQTGFDFQ